MTCLITNRIMTFSKNAKEQNVINLKFCCSVGTWKAKCHILFMHELSGGKGGMRNTWHGDCHVSK